MMSLISFDSTQAAILAEGLLLAKGLKVRVMPLPSYVKAGCGICLNVNQDDLAIITECLDTQIANRYSIHTIERV